MKTERKHTVKASIQILDLSRAGSSLELEVFSQEPSAERPNKIGTLVIGRGSMTWTKVKGKKKCRITWPQFAEVMEGSDGPHQGLKEQNHVDRVL